MPVLGPAPSRLLECVMTVLRPVLLGLGAGAVVAFVVALLAPRRPHEAGQGPR